jgi:hypothetical protein
VQPSLWDRAQHQTPHTVTDPTREHRLLGVFLPLRDHELAIILSYHLLDWEWRASQLVCAFWADSGPLVFEVDACSQSTGEVVAVGASLYLTNKTRATLSAVKALLLLRFRVDGALVHYEPDLIDHDLAGPQRAVGMHPVVILGGD